LWEVKDIVLRTSSYAAEESRRNLHALRPDRMKALQSLLREVRLVEHLPCRDTGASPELPPLPEKDRPILQAAIRQKANLLLTVDRKHFAALFGKTVEGVLVSTPGWYLTQLGPPLQSGRG
jgi:uncharacterized protein